MKPSAYASMKRRIERAYATMLPNRLDPNQGTVYLFPNKSVLWIIEGESLLSHLPVIPAEAGSSFLSHWILAKNVPE